MVANPLSFPNQPVGKATSIIYSTSITQKPADLQFTMTWDSSFTEHLPGYGHKYTGYIPSRGGYDMLWPWLYHETNPNWTPSSLV